MLGKGSKKLDQKDQSARLYIKISKLFYFEIVRFLVIQLEQCYLIIIAKPNRISEFGNL